MTKSVANQIAKLWNSQFGGFTEETRTEAVVKECKLLKTPSYSVDIIPTGANDGRAFFRVDELSFVAHTFKASSHIIYINEQCVGRIH